MEIISKLNKSQFNEVKKLYTDFFRSINFNNYYKENNILTIEIEVAKENNIYKKLERNNWQRVLDFDDASVFIRKI